MNLVNNVNIIENEKQSKKQRLANWAISKEELSYEWIENSGNFKNRYIKQGDIFICELGENIGHEQNKGRPVLILSNTRYNENGLATIAPLTSTIRADDNVLKIKTHYVLRKENYDFLENNSTVLVENIKTVSSVRLGNYIGNIEESDFSAIKTRLKTLFNIK